MRTKHKIGTVPVFLIILLASVLLYGCGNAKKEAPESAATGVATNGFTSCYKCHADSKNPLGLTPDPTIPSLPFGDTVSSTGWLDGVHSNSNNTPGYSAFSDSTCAACHDQLEDGRTIENFSLDTGIAVLGTADRPVVGCESCHGGGGNHFGLGPLPFPKSDGTKCAACHSASFPHLASNPEGGSIGEGFLASRHANSKNVHVTDFSGSTTDIAALCGRCHTDEGAKRYISLVNGTDDYTAINTALSAKPAVADASTVQCRTCHVNMGHGPNKLLGEIANSAAFPVGASNEFKTCTSCHQLLTSTGGLLDNGYHAPYNKGGTSVNQFSSVEEIIADTHYDDPATPQLVGDANTDWVAGTGGIEGYIVKSSGTHSTATGNTNQGICRDCHNPHNADTTINRQWARSAHGGHILEKKEGAANAYTAAVLDEDAPGWIHYNWKRTGRAACQRCHTSTGFRNFANNQAAYDANDDTTPDVANVFVATGSQMELLYCWACHTDNVGGIRNPGQIIANYDVTISSLRRSEVHYTYPDRSSSNVCMGCHTGRESGDSIVFLNTGQPGTTAVNFTNLSFINSHYLTAGGTVFTATGYEYSTKSYANPASYKHDQIGTAGAPGTGTAGPCAGCHMSAPESHLFLPVTRDASGTITAVTSPVCSTASCHPGGEALGMSPSMLENQKALIHDALEALLRQLDVRGYYFRNAHPYFYVPRVTTGTVAITSNTTTVTGTGTTWLSAGIVIGASGDQFKVNLEGTYYTIASVDSDTQLTLSAAYTGPTVTTATYSIIRTTGVTNWLTTGDADTTGATTGKNNMGAAFNYNLLEHDPGAFAHNRYYSKRLIYDAIDWLDDNILNDSVSATLNALNATEYPYKANAISYLLVSGGRP